jgi:hypothetical protein
MSESGVDLGFDLEELFLSSEDLAVCSDVFSQEEPVAFSSSFYELKSKTVPERLVRASVLFAMVTLKEL